MGRGISNWLNRLDRSFSLLVLRPPLVGKILEPKRKRKDRESRYERL